MTSHREAAPVVSSSYDAEFWRKHWERGGSGFTPAERGNLVTTIWPRLRLRAGSRVLVPLAGKSPDMAWLASRGFGVVGVEISPIPCAAFFAERGIAAETTKAGPFTCWRGGGVTILQGDFFDLDGMFAAGLDRGALVSFPAVDRPRYAEHLRSRLNDGAPVLLVTLEYDATRRAAPPFPVFPDEVRRLWPGATEHSRWPLRRARWEAIGGAETVVWTVTS
jgi:thiopurine S-methyltransferase